MSKTRWAILGTGMIARAFAKGLKASEHGELAAVGSRKIETAQPFCAEFGGLAYGSYQEAIEADVDAVYNALPHDLHADWTIKAAEAGRAVLCEKPFTLNQIEARRALAVVEQAGVPFMEAFMYRCHPQIKEIQRLAHDGAVGEVHHVSADFGFAAGWGWDNFRVNNAQGGGALMDVGCYCVSMAIEAFDSPVLSAQYQPFMTESKYDAYGAGMLNFGDGRGADFRTAVHHTLRSQAIFFGSKGRIEVDEPLFSEGEIRVYSRESNEPTHTIAPTLGLDRYALEADEVSRMIREGLKESPDMPIRHTLWVMEALDMLRASCGFEFEGEAKA
jgi:predicted dehydrogenase